jgi:hypothetical protein
MVGGAIMAAHNSSACQVSISHDQLNRVFAGQGTNLEELGCTGQLAGWWHEAAVQAQQPTGSIICRDRRGVVRPCARDVLREEEMATALMQLPELASNLRTLFFYGGECLQTSAIEARNERPLKPEPALVQQADHEDRDGYPMSVITFLRIPRRLLARKVIAVKRVSAYGLWNEGQKEAETLECQPLPDGFRQHFMGLLELLTR